MIKCICLYCGKNFEILPCSIRKGEGKYCCQDCANKARVGIPRSPEVIERIRTSNLGKKRSEKTRNKISESKKGKARSMESRQKQSISNKGKSGVWNKGRVHSEESKKKTSLAMKGRIITEIHRSKISEALVGIERTDEWILKSIETKIGGFWYGNVRYNNAPKYCEKWEDVNARVHAFFGNRCAVCGAPENGKAHMGHHVFYVKKACCWHNEDGVYYTNLNAPDHPEHDYCIGENPNYFVLLCNSCHSKTNGKFENRKKWADYFRTLIDERYGGKCYTEKE